MSSLKKAQQLYNEYIRYFKEASQKNGSFKAFRQKFTSSQKEKIIKKIADHVKDLEKVQKGDPIFKIGDLQFTLGTASQPAFDVESTPNNSNPRQLKIYIGFKENLIHKLKSIKDIRTYLGLQELYEVVTLKYHRYQRKTPEQVAKQRKNGLLWKASNPEERIRLVKEEHAKSSFRISFPLSDLFLFIDQISLKHPAVALALAKVYLGKEPGSNINCDLARKVADIAKIGKKRLSGEKEKVIKNLIGPLWRFKTKKKKFGFREYQKIGIAFWRAAGGRALIGDEMGIGKTIQAIGCMKLASLDKKLPNPYPALIVCPKSVLYMWQGELREWIPEARPQVVTGSDLRKIRPQNKDVIITTYASMAIYADHLKKMGFKMMILDESHNIKNPNANRTKAALEIGFEVPLIVELSGSPEEKELSELWPQFHLIAPKKFPTLQTFLAAMETITYNPQTKKLGSVLPSSVPLYGGKKVLNEHYQISSGNRYLAQPVMAQSSGGLGEPLKCYMIRRLKSQVLDLPPKERQINNIKLDNKARALYEQMEMDAAKRLFGARMIKWAKAVAETTKDLMRTGVKKSVAIKQAKSKHLELLDYANQDSKQLALALFQILRLQSEFLKIPMVVEWVKEFYQTQSSKEGLLIFAEQHKVIDSIKKQIGQFKKRNGQKICVATYTGRTSDTERKRIVKEFQAGKIDVLILNRAGGEGITLHRASYVLFATRYWNPGHEEQAEDRAHRSGQKKTVNVYYFNILPWNTNAGFVNPMDNRLNMMIEAKRERIKNDIGNQSYKTENKTKQSITKEMVRDLAKKFSKITSKAKDENRALKQAFKQAGIR